MKEKSFCHKHKRFWTVRHKGERWNKEVKEEKEQTENG